ncbi:MAG: hypothetical protein H6737_28840 [Alphaproteobacteria bacterium]|nr:hypothetical protein [Alphaproteobacteria bacterium]
MKAKEDALRASAHIDPETRAELDALQDSLDAKQAAAQGAVLDAMSGYAEAKAADEAARAELANALRANSRAGCDDATPAPAARIEACSPWVDAHPTDAAGLFFLVEAHMALAQAGTDAAENARRAIARLEQLRPLLPDQATSIDDAIAGLRPLVE